MRSVDSFIVGESIAIIEFLIFILSGFPKYFLEIIFEFIWADVFENNLLCLFTGNIVQISTIV